jgi:hypothetical protein
MRIGRMVSIAFATVMGARSVGALPLGDHVIHLRVPDGDVAFTLVGQVTNTPPDKSIQAGYIPTIEGLTSLFASTPESEANAFFTFVNDAQTTAARHDGPLTIVERIGTATVYLQSAPHGDFADPESFRGDPILVMDLKQQVVLDGGTKLFTVVISETVTDSNRFEWNGKTYDLAFKGDRFRVSFTGTLNAAPPPSGYFSGYAVKIARAVGWPF